jgi:predicted amidohydrolase YtcJ
MTGDLLVRDGRLFTPAGVVDAALLVQDGVIAAIGGDALERARPGTPELDARGGLVTPGFQDAHVHPYHAGIDLLRLDLSEARGAAEYLDRIAAYCTANPDLEWIRGGGWAMEAFPGGVPTAAALDAVTGGRPAYLNNRDGHGAWVNSAALERAGVTADTPDPADGRIERDAAGHPIGMLQEGAMDLVSDLMPPTTDEEIDEAFLVAQERLLAWGVTGWQDAMIGVNHGLPDLLASSLRLADRGAVVAHVVGALWWERDRGLEQIPELIERRALAAGRDRFRATSVKIMQDGVVENFTAAVLRNYLDHHGHDSGNAGKSFVDPAVLTEAVTALDAAGFQVHLHTLGDRAVREALDAIETARAVNGPRDARHHLAHLQLVHPDDVPRFAALGAVANAQPYWATHEPQMDELAIPFLGPERARWQYPFGSLARAGATLAFGSDWSVTTANPLEIIHVAVNRAAYGEGPQEPLYGEQALSLGDALAAATAGSAFVNHDEDRAGRIALGLAGDLAVLDRDITALPVNEIGAAAVAATVVGGSVVSEGAF